MTRQLFFFILTGAIATVPSIAWAELRKPNPAEQKVLTQYITIINRVLDHFQGDDWNERVDYALDDEIMVHPDSGRPLDVDEMFQRTYDVRPGSERFNRMVQPVIDKMQQEPDINKKSEIIKRVQDQMHVEVEIHFNRETIEVDPPPAANSDLHIPGAAFAYKVNHSSSAHGISYILAFGSWSQMNWDDKNHGYHFKFAHPQNTAYIENIEILVSGAPDRLEELLHSVDWKQVNDALTH